MTWHNIIIMNIIEMISIYFIETTLKAGLQISINFRDSSWITRTQTWLGSKIGLSFQENACRIPRACACAKPTVTHKKRAQEA